MSGPKRNPDSINTIGIVVVGICSAVLVYVSIVALQAFYMNDTSEIQTMADYGGQDTGAKKLRSDQLQNISDSGRNQAGGTYHIPIDKAMELVARDAKTDPSHLVPTLPPSTKSSIEPVPGRPRIAPPPAAPAGGAPEGAPASPAGGAGGGSGATETGSHAAPMVPTGAGGGPQPVNGAGALPSTGTGTGSAATGTGTTPAQPAQPKGGAQTKAGTQQVAPPPPKAGATTPAPKAGATTTPAPKAGATTTPAPKAGATTTQPPAQPKAPAPKTGAQPKTP